MIITSIELENFMCYYGSNKFEFSEGINVIIGDNGYGKSKLFDAFYWVMYDECFDTRDKTFKNTSLLNKSIVSDRAIFEAENEEVTCSVIINLKDDAKGSTYSLERRYLVKKEGENVNPSSNSEEIISWKELSYLNSRIIDDPSQIARLKQRILPDNIKPYMWFQGEQVESIIDFNKSQTLTQAINILSNISRFDNIIEVSKSLKGAAEKEYTRKQKALSKDSTRSEKLEKEKIVLEEELTRLEEDQELNQNNFINAKARAEELLGKQKDAQEIRKKNLRRDQLEMELTGVVDDLKHKRINLHKKLLTNKWVLKGAQHLFDEYSKTYDNYDEARLRLKVEKKVKLDAQQELKKKIQTRLPMDVPEPIYVERMLEEEICLVCDRKALKGTEEWNKIKELIDRDFDTDQIDEEESLHDFSTDFKKLYHNGLVLSHVISGIDDNIKNAFSEVERLNTKRKSIEKDLGIIEDKIKSMLSESSLSLQETEDIVSEYLEQDKFARKFEVLARTTVSDINIKSKRIEAIKTELGELVTGEMPKALTLKVELTDDFNSIITSTRDRVYHELVNMLEKEANIHYQNMTQDNLSARGIIKLKQLSNKNYMPELVDELGNRLLQLNTGNILLIKLATIMAIISARKGSRDTNLYTLITDAPMSVFGEDYTIGFCKTVSTVYRQSIIMSKEFYKNRGLRKQLLTNSDINLGRVYMITPSIPEDQRANRNTLATNIEPLN